MASKRTTLPPIPASATPAMKQWYSAISEIVDTGEGTRGNALDRKLTLRDLVDSGLADFKIRGNPGSGIMPGVGIGTGGKADLTPPPGPSGISVDGSFWGFINISWDPPSDLYKTHAYTNIYRSEEDNFANAVIVGRDSGMFYSDKVRDGVQDVNNIKGYYYWITFTSLYDVEGPPNSPDGTYAEPMVDVQYLIETISKNFQDKPVSAGGPDETFIINAMRFAVKITQDGESTYPFMIDVVNGVPTIIMNTVIIKDGSIESGKLGPITFGKITDQDGNPITTIGGLIRADMIDVDNLHVTNANIAGTIQSDSFNVNGQRRWVLDKDGGLSLNGGGANGRMELRDSYIKVFDSADRRRVQLGDLNA
jgi:hypothetical protein